MHAEWGAPLVERWGTDPELIKTALNRIRLTADPAFSNRGFLLND